MPRFIYRQGLEGDGTKMPAEVAIFGVEFVKNQPTEVRADMFRDPERFAHALMKLRQHPHFEEDKAEEAVFVEVKPDRKRKAQPVVEAPPADEPTE